ncbi:nucleotidyltransferase domain-containing protein [Flavobacterium johnsoniae]|uniref:Polymerase nucleotidyl transferase domain-containing protein n=1 Tax=Flavobacterium johnsoniae (strain ATCC 17061 / DSM 2064 / JCM 8514 / BCRC 14874 / CCUG 350202 / NBRC 14942 / NCIMB 11054 / UW101) TaxID=376686 RepID=A5FHI6_FLAJ1|nr:nucleotidyltransferase domain-containing protein [Flavobacterium johnsoniae]ABQ05334.1 hypothetical protein Fjoh_2307 [Flavobacterium johnsoniae UW101]OXE94982.1 hypothetical protein B0A63_26010 [Flavobacterium johnsoniae UW101]WQG82863.1 nucleotidyltransferase domain-containing protein [Flavobacterium johnsoniae UW101]SHL59458.1 Nucleotidyltransferase domain-containing protein [Flavobacterium johnsoniae]
MEIYAFGSITRGDIDKLSDVDLLLLKDIDEKISDIDKEQFSIYSYQRILELWKEGNPFAWHLYSESKCIFCTNSVSYIESLGKPSQYKNLLNDLNKFYKLFNDSKDSIEQNNYSIDFDLSMIFLSIRNFASCFSLGYLGKLEFSRDSAIKINLHPLKINPKTYDRLKQSRLLATRGIGKKISKEELETIQEDFPEIEKWFNRILILIK